MSCSKFIKVCCFFLAAALIFSSCRKNIPIEILIHAGDQQLVPLNETLDDALEIQALNHKGEPIEGLEVTFLIKSGSGYLEGQVYQKRDTTDSSGIARMIWTFGPENFDQQVEAHVKRYNGPPLVFTASPEFAEDPADGEKYLLIKMGSYVWMGQNMRKATSGALVNPNSPSTIYGNLYPWDDLAGLCPAGFHVSTNAEWEDLIAATGNEFGSIGRKLKSTLGWIEGGAGLNLSGFNIYPSGNHLDSLNFRGLGEYGSFWTADEDTTNTANAYYRIINYEGNNFLSAAHGKTNLSSCRCVQDY